MSMQHAWQTQLQQYAQEHNINEAGQTFFLTYYEDVDSEDLSLLPVSDLVAAARSHQRTAAMPRLPRQSHSEISQQTPEAEFASNETDINIVLDD